ncbi:hypothetical protein OF83DRAFT_1086281 [Amylostereum chailletii]|nr:hypothetical protein OF83DRAFT_1086281 [Amylostereum chailletii]
MPHVISESRSAYQRHRLTCTATRQKVSGALSALKSQFKHKRPLFDAGDSSSSLLMRARSNTASQSSTPSVDVPEEGTPPVSGDEMSYAERETQPSPPHLNTTPPPDQDLPEQPALRTRWNRGILPKRFQQESPVPVAAVPLYIAPTGASLNARSGEWPALDSPVNPFGLFHRYFSSKFPSHDPEEYFVPSDLTNGVPRTDSPHPSLPDEPLEPDRPPSPFPNMISYRLAQWFWLGGLQKTYKNFKELLRIISHPGFKPQNVTTTDWAHLQNRVYGG